MLKAVIFDIDDTLYRQMDSFETACRQFPALSGLSAEALFQARSIRGMEALRRMNAGLFTLAENHAYRMVMACRDLGVTLTDQEAMDFQAVYEEAQRQLTVTPGMEAVLDLCKVKGWRLGVLTNGPSDHQRRKFQVLQLERWIPGENIVVSGDCGILKPDVRLFRFAETKLGLNPVSTMLVGDSYENDILGAEAAGWQCFWLRRETPGHREQDLLDLLSHR